VRRRIHSGRVTAEKAYRIKDRRLAIYAAQLHTLGVSFTNTDLEYHFLLRSMRKQKFTPDLVYLDWAESWLQRLQEANRRALCDPGAGFLGIVGWFLVEGWLVGLALSRLDGWGRFGGLALRGNAWQGLRKAFSLSSPFLRRTESCLI